MKHLSHVKIQLMAENVHQAVNQCEGHHERTSDGRDKKQSCTCSLEKNETFLHLISFTKMLLPRRFVSYLIIQVIF